MLHYILMTCLALGALSLTDTSAERFDLSFSPANGDNLAVSCVVDSQWDYAKSGMKGNFHTELLIRWRIARQDGVSQFTGKGAFERVLYQSTGSSKERAYDHDLEWNKDKGYLRGKDSEADEKWCAEEIRDGVTLTFDSRGACKQGEC